MSEPIKIECWLTEDAVCPYCGHRHDCSHEFFEGVQSTSTKADCSECGKIFHIEAEYSVHYTTSKPTENASE